MAMHQKSKMKDLLAQGLYLLILQKPFEKITIKQICDKTGVIRGTFYNHFMDKYEALEYLTESLILDSSEETLQKGDFFTFLKNSLYTVEKHKEFFYKAFQIEGQNNFMDMLHGVYSNALNHYFVQNHIDLKKAPFTKETLISYQMASLTLIIKNWVSHSCNKSCDEIMNMIEYFYKNSLYDILHA
ncbi:MAG: TetR/AcrR family transcriptional regulator C-terminal domain-containing protein [Traorella sp.]